MSETSKFTSGDVGRIGRAGCTYDSIHQWVALSGVSGLAVTLYQFYRMHVNDKRGDCKAWPGMVALGKMLGVPARRITALNDELVQIDAIRIHQEGMPRHNVYTIFSEPPPDYDGPANLTEWYERHGDALAEERSALAAKAEANRVKAKGQVNPVLPESAVLEGGTPVLSKTAVLVLPKSAVLVLPKSAVELNEVELNEVNQNPPTPRDQLSETSAPVEVEPEGGKIPSGKPSKDDPHWRAAQELLRGLIAPIVERSPEQNPVNGKKAELMELTIGALNLGWTPAALAAELGKDDLRRANDLGGMIRARLLRLPEPPAPARRGGTRCEKGHRGQPAGNCAVCRGEKLGADMVIEAPKDLPARQLTAREAMEAIKAKVSDAQRALREQENRRLAKLETSRRKAAELEAAK